MSTDFSPNPPRPLTVDEMRQLMHLLCWAMGGSEHGRITYTQWQGKCRELVTFLNARGYYPHGQWIPG